MKVVKVSEPKTKRGKRVISLARDTIAALKEQAARQADEAQEWGDAWVGEDGYIFTRENGEPLHPDRVSKLFENAVSKAPVPRIRLHDLRHTCATLALQAGVHVKVVCEMLGHANISIALDTYSHVIPAMQEAAADRIAALFSVAP